MEFKGVELGKRYNHLGNIITVIKIQTIQEINEPEKTIIVVQYVDSSISDYSSVKTGDIGWVKGWKEVKPTFALTFEQLRDFNSCYGDTTFDIKNFLSHNNIEEIK